MAGVVDENGHRLGAAPHPAQRRARLGSVVAGGVEAPDLHFGVERTLGVLAQHDAPVFLALAPVDAHAHAAPPSGQRDRAASGVGHGNDAGDVMGQRLAVGVGYSGVAALALLAHGRPIMGVAAVEEDTLGRDAGDCPHLLLDGRDQRLGAQADQVEGDSLALDAGGITLAQHQRGGGQIVVHADGRRPAGESGHANSHWRRDHHPRGAGGQYPPRIAIRCAAVGHDALLTLNWSRTSPRPSATPLQFDWRGA